MRARQKYWLCLSSVVLTLLAAVASSQAGQLIIENAAREDISQQQNFWASFFPSVTATLIGVVLGLPTALWLNSQAGKSATTEQKWKDHVLLLAGLKLLLAAMMHNRERLLVHMQNLEKNMALFDLDLDTVAWDAVRDQIFPTLNNPSLHGKTALHFVRLLKSVKLSDSYLDMTAGIASAIGGVDHTKELLRKHLTNSSGGLFNEAGEIARDITEIINELGVLAAKPRKFSFPFKTTS